MTSVHPLTRSRRRRAVALLSAAALTLLALPAAATDAGPEDPGLSQQIDPDQEVATDEMVLDRGHVDLGPRFVDDEWTLMVHDDTNVEGSVWRPLSSTVLKVSDAAQLEVPDDEAYAFLGVEPGEPVHVVPQTENPEVVWIGWNTQDPQVMDTIDRGITLSLAAVEGPGEVVVYLQDGGFGEPDVLWDSRETQAQDAWVEINTHTHANWVFSEPGTYLVQLRATADLVDGTQVTDTQAVRLSVGDAADPQEALDAEADLASQGPADEAEVDTDQSEASSIGLLAVIVVGALALIVVIVTVVVVTVGRSARRRALQEQP